MRLPSTREPSFIATVGYVRRLRIGSLRAYCEGKRDGGWPCYHSATVAIAAFADNMPLREIERRLRCEACGTRGEVEVRPNWNEITRRYENTATGWMMPPGHKLPD